MGTTLPFLQLQDWLTHTYNMGWLYCAILVRCRACSPSVKAGWGQGYLSHSTATGPAVTLPQGVNGHGEGEHLHSVHAASSQMGNGERLPMLTISKLAHPHASGIDG